MSEITVSIFKQNQLHTIDGSVTYYMNNVQLVFIVADNEIIALC